MHVVRVQKNPQRKPNRAKKRQSKKGDKKQSPWTQTKKKRGSRLGIEPTNRTAEKNLGYIYPTRTNTCSAKRTRKGTPVPDYMA